MKKILKLTILVLSMVLAISMFTGCASLLEVLLGGGGGSSSGSGDSTYIVEHYKQKTNDDGYLIESSDTERYNANAGERTRAVARNYNGFTVRPIQQDVVQADGSTVVKVYYDRKYTTIRFNLAGGTTNSNTEIRGKYGSHISSMIEEPTREGYEFDGWNYPLPITFPSEDKTYTAKWKAVEVTSNQGSSNNAVIADAETKCTIFINFDDTLKRVIPKAKAKKLKKRGFTLGPVSDVEEVYIPVIEMKVAKGETLGSVIDIDEIEAMVVPAVGYEYSGIYKRSRIVSKLTLADPDEPITEDTYYLVKAVPKQATNNNPYGPFKVTITLAPVLTTGKEVRKFCDKPESRVKLNSAGNVFTIEVPAGEPLYEYVKSILHDFYPKAPATGFDGIFEGDKKIDLNRPVTADKYYILRSKALMP